MPWKHLISGMMDIFGPPGADGLALDTPRLGRFRDLISKAGLGKSRSKDVADGYLALVPRKKRRGAGVYYTPQQVIEFILDQTLPAPRLGPEVKHPYPPSFRVLEPACGSGYFLLSAYRKFRETYSRIDVDPGRATRKILLEHLAAVDVDGDAVMVAAAALLREADEEIDLALAEGPINLPLFRADFLDKNYDKSKSKLGALIRNGFPAIVGNPPYVSFYSKRARTISEGDREYYKANYRTGKGRINTFCLFVERAFDLLTPSGTLGFVVPNTLLIMKSYEPLRRHLVENGWLKSIVDLSLKVFPEVEVPTCVLVAERRDPRALQFPRVLRTGFWESARGSIPTDLEERVQSEFERLPYCMFNIHITGADREVLDAIESAGTPLGDSFEVRDGINPANVTKKVVVRSDQSLPLPFRPVLRGKDISPYQLTWDNMWVRYDKSFIDKAQGELCFFREERIFTRIPKILTRQTADRLIAAWDEMGHYALNTLHITIPHRDTFDLKCLLALYNSKLLNYYYRLLFPDTERVFPQVKTVNVEKLPLPRMNGDAELLCELADKLINPAGRDNGKISREKVLAEIDSIVYGLYKLKPDHVARIERSPYTSSSNRNRS
jgi:methylase of polypeptide subunit release factors